MVARKQVAKCLPQDFDRSIHFAKHGEEALDAICDNKGDLLLLDLNMPVMDGWEFLDALEESNISSDVFVSIVTSSLDYTDKHKAEEYRKILSYIEKPLSLKSLEELKSMTQLNAFFK